MLWGCVGCCQIGFMSLIVYKDDLVKKTQLPCIYHVNGHDEHFLVCILRTYCCRLIQPVKMYVNWYMMWYLKKDMFCKEHILFG